MSEVELLHPEIFGRFPIIGRQYGQELLHRGQELASATESMADPDLTVLIRTRNNENRMEGLFLDIGDQSYTGNVQLVVVDTESSDRTVDIAKAYGATVLNIAQADFTYPLSLNVGFEAADNPFVVTLTNRCNLVSTVALRSITRWCGQDTFGGLYGPMIWDEEASVWETGLVVRANAQGKRLAEASPIPVWQGGAMVGHRSIVSKAAWQELGGYDNWFGRGGEDTDFARRLLSEDFLVVREPAMAVHHSHGRMSLMHTIRHARELKQLRQGKSGDFDASYMRSVRPDMAA